MKIYCPDGDEVEKTGTQLEEYIYSLVEAPNGDFHGIRRLNEKDILQLKALLEK